MGVTSYAPVRSAIASTSSEESDRTDVDGSDFGNSCSSCSELDPADLDESPTHCFDTFPGCCSTVQPVSFAAARRRAIVVSSLVVLATLTNLSFRIRDDDYYDDDGIGYCDQATLESCSPVHASGNARQWYVATKAAEMVDSICLVLQASIFCFIMLRWWKQSRYLNEVRWHLLWTWLLTTAFLVLNRCGAKCRYPRFVSRAHPWDASAYKMAVLIGWRMTYALCYAVAIWNIALVRMRIAVLERASAAAGRYANLGSRTLGRIIAMIAVAAIIVTVTACGKNLILGGRHTGPLYFVANCIMVFSAVLSLVLTVLVIATSVRAYWLSWFLAWTEAKRCEPGSEDWAVANYAARVARRHLVTLACSLPLFVPCVLAQLADFVMHSPWVSFWTHSINTTSFVAVSICVLTVSGLLESKDLFRGSFVTTCSRCSPVAKPSSKKGRPSQCWSSGDKAWDDKVKELAQRGLTLKALLHFYRGLGSHDSMPHFDPALHTTSDVVRQAIIPRSRGGPGRRDSTAMATVLMRGRCVMPTSMVTHNWSNLFSHLVAAVVADALDVSAYDGIVARLSAPDELQALESELYWKGGLDRTYWICAFCVNQHASICHKTLPHDVDPVLRVAHPRCDCSCSKHYNDTPPVRASDGQSIVSEMNKFDEMMDFLAYNVPQFGQVIAVDSDFVLFSRAWCVAEIHQAYSRGFRQSMKFTSRASLEGHTEELRELRVENMAATSRADAELILSKIADKAAFDAELQQLIFSEEGGLLTTITDGNDLFSMLGMVVSRSLKRTDTH